MTEYLLLFRNPVGNQSYMATPEEMQAAIPAWGKWMGSIAAENKLVRSEPVTFEGSVVRPGQTSAKPHLENGQAVTGFLLCRAESQADAERIAAGCPIFQYPGASVEVRAVIPFPQP